MRSSLFHDPSHSRSSLFGDHFPKGAVHTDQRVELVGIGSHEPDALYQFETTDGTYVSLHELDCVGVQVGIVEQSITLTFAAGSSPEPVLRMHFDGARVLHWCVTTPLAPPEHTGQVSDLWWDNCRTFALCLIDDEIAFTATRLTVTTHRFPDLR